MTRFAPRKAISRTLTRKLTPDLVPLVQQLIKKKSAKWSPDMVSDPIQEALLKLIAEKKKLLKPRKATKGKAVPGASVQCRQHHGRASKER